MKNKKFLQNTLTVSLGCLLSKLIGGFSRVPLTALLGGRGMGLYQLVYPFYAFLLTFCSSGVSTAVAKMVADEKYLGGVGAFKTASRAFIALGALGGILLFLLSDTFASLQGEPMLAPSFRLIAPSLPAVALLSVYRGWFQGKNDMMPTAFSMVEENCIKVASSILFALLLPGDLYQKVAFLFFGVTASEVIACYSLFYSGKRYRYPLPLYQKRVSIGELLKTSVPIALSASVLPFSSFLDSFFIVRLLSRYEANALSLYGVYSGAALTLANIPVTVCYGVSVAIVPFLAAGGSGEEKKKSFLLSLLVTFLLALPCAAGLYLFCPLAVKILFSGFGEAEREILISLVKILSLSALLLPMVQTLSSCLAARGKATYSTLFLLVSVAVKTVLLFVWINEKNGISGAAYAVNICYFVAFVLNLSGNLSVQKGETYDNDRGARRGAGRFNGKRQTGYLVCRKSHRKDDGNEILPKRGGLGRGVYLARLRLRKKQKFYHAP